ncbi:Uncharacterised protein [Enterobacter asburiae]|uniref:Uncharacterized protein n=1 Tax=Enterobacter asburiae TaxID=61645 RepID=A0A376FDJ2_ENTAS|nr:Uncharacterised protein [Enterobacter asburiae]
MGADKLDAVGNLPLQRFPGARFDILMAEQRLALRPALNAFEQRAGLVPVRLTRGLCRIKMDMRLNERRDRKPAARVQYFITFGVSIVHRGDVTKSPVLNGKLPQPFPTR